MRCSLAVISISPLLTADRGPTDVPLSRLQLTAAILLKKVDTKCFYIKNNTVSVSLSSSVIHCTL